MRGFALTCAIVVALAVGVLNFIDTKYPNVLQIIRGSPSPTAPSPQVRAEPRPVEPPPPKAARPAQPERVPLEDADVRAIYPGAKVDRVVYGARPYTDMTIVSISSQNVVLRNDREIVSIPTGSLPDDLRQQAIAYLSGSDGPPFARTGVPAFPVADAPAPAPAAPVAITPSPQQQKTPDAPPDFEAVAWQAARDRAEKWLRFERERRVTDIVPLLTGVDLQTPLPMSGLPGYWKIRGRGYVATYQAEKGGTFHDFEITVVLDANGNVVRSDIKIL